MFKRYVKLILLVVGVIALASPADASVKALTSTEQDLGPVEGIKGVKRVQSNLGIPYGEIEFALADFIGVNSDDTFQLTRNTTPGILHKNEMSYIRWTDGETSPIEKTFRVPEDYVSGGQFRVLLGRSGLTSLPPRIDYSVFVNSTLTAFDSAATNQTAVAINETGDGSPEEKTLTVTTDFSSLSPGDYVTVRFWRDSTGTDALEFYGAAFEYNN